MEKRGVEVRRADFEAADSLATAFRDVDRALIVSTDAVDRPGRRFEQHLNAVNRAAEAGVKHVVYTSLTNPEPGSLVAIAPDHWQTEELLRKSALGYTVLRNNLYADYLLGSLPHHVKSGKITNAYGSGRIGYITREDCARAAAAALASSSEERVVHDIAGPLLTQSELAAIISDVTSRPVEYVAVDGDTSKRNLVAAGLPEPIASLLVSFELAGAKGQLASASNAVATLTGRPPTTVRELLVENRSALLD